MRVLVSCRRKDDPECYDLKNSVEEAFEKAGHEAREIRDENLEDAFLLAAQYDVLFVDEDFVKEFRKDLNMNIKGVPAPYKVDYIVELLEEQYGTN